MADQTYVLTTAGARVLSGGGVFRCSFREGTRVRHGVVGSEWSLAAPGDTVTTQDAEAQSILAAWTNDNGALMFQRDDGAARGEYLDTTFDRFRAQRVR